MSQRNPRRRHLSIIILQLFDLYFASRFTSCPPDSSVCRAAVSFHWESREDLVTSYQNTTSALSSAVTRKLIDVSPSARSAWESSMGRDCIEQCALLFMPGNTPLSFWPIIKLDAEVKSTTPGAVLTSGLTQLDNIGIAIRNASKHFIDEGVHYISGRCCSHYCEHTKGFVTLSLSPWQWPVNICISPPTLALPPDLAYNYPCLLSESHCR